MNSKSAAQLTLQTSIVNNSAYVVLVYAHTECNRCNNDLTHTINTSQHILFTQHFLSMFLQICVSMSQQTSLN